jgi:hypothetical protein
MALATAATVVVASEREEPSYNLEETLDFSLPSSTGKSLLPQDLIIPNENIAEFLDKQNEQAPLKYNRDGGVVFSNARDSVDTAERLQQENHTSYNNGLPDSVNAYLDQFKSDDSYAYDEDMGMERD